MSEEWITTAHAAEISGYNEEHIRRLIRAGKLAARRDGPVWQVSHSSLLKYVAAAKISGDTRRGPQTLTI